MQQQDPAVLSERIRLYFKGGQRDFDEFDNILLQMVMQVMHDPQGIDHKANPMYKQVLDTFLRRATRREFPVVKYIVYLQFSIVVAQDQELLDSLLRFGFDEIYEKLRWLDKVTSLEVASQLQAPYL